MRAFRQLLDFYEVDDYKACATSAMREASNAIEIVKLVSQEAGIAIEIIDGKTEAQIIYANHIIEKLNEECNYLYVDVGGGSTELTLFSQKQLIISKSFNVGTIRFLNDIVNKELWAEFKDWIKKETKNTNPLLPLGLAATSIKYLRCRAKSKTDQCHSKN